MINDINNYPLTKISDKMFIEGYWQNIDDESTSHYPTPLSTNNTVDKLFLKKLRQYMKDIDDAKHNPDYHNRSHVVEMKGSSKCRICGIINGSKEYYLLKNNNWFRIPSGLIHYYEMHMIEPSREFYEFVTCDDDLITSSYYHQLLQKNE
jgi:hypothetical protein